MTTAWTTRPETDADIAAIRSTNGAALFDPTRPVPTGTVRYTAAFGV